MNGSLQYSALTRLLTLNNQAHDLEHQLLAEKVPALSSDRDTGDQAFPGSRIAEIQEELDRVVRASLATCWLGNSDAEDEEYEL